MYTNNFTYIQCGLFIEYPYVYICAHRGFHSKFAGSLYEYLRVYKDALYSLHQYNNNNRVNVIQYIISG